MVSLIVSISRLLFGNLRRCINAQTHTTYKNHMPNVNSMDYAQCTQNRNGAYDLPYWAVLLIHIDSHANACIIHCAHTIQRIIINLEAITRMSSSTTPPNNIVLCQNITEKMWFAKRPSLIYFFSLIKYGFSTNAIPHSISDDWNIFQQYSGFCCSRSMHFIPKTCHSHISQLHIHTHNYIFDLICIIILWWQFFSFLPT